VKEIKRQYRERNKETIRLQRKQYAEKNKEVFEQGSGRGGEGRGAKTELNIRCSMRGAKIITPRTRNRSSYAKKKHVRTGRGK
jgi:hypothetical protein